MKVKSESEVTQSCLTLSDPMDCSLPGSSIHGILQARVLKWGAIAFSPMGCIVHWNSPGQNTGVGSLIVHWNSPGQNTGVGSLSILQGTFPTQGSNLGLLHRGQILYQLSYKGSPRILEWAAHSFSSWSSQPRNWTWVSFIAGRLFTNWAIKENRQCRRCRFNPWIGKISWSRKTCFSIFSWRIPRTEEPGRLQSMELQRIGHDWAWMHYCLKIFKLFLMGSLLD